MAAAELPEMPNGPIMELHGQRKRFHVPHGLKPLLEEITREILRYQPEDIYTFLTKYMEEKLVKRAQTQQETHRKSWQWRRWSTDGSSALNKEELQEFLEELNVSKNQADQYAIKIQSAFRGHKARKSLAEQGKVLHKDHRKSWEWKRWGWEGSSELPKEQLDEFLKDIDVPLEQANKYATKIQAVYRGHAVRRSLGEAGAHVALPNISKKSKTEGEPQAENGNAKKASLQPEEGSTSEEEAALSEENEENPESTEAKRASQPEARKMSDPQAAEKSGSNEGGVGASTPEPESDAEQPPAPL